MAELEHTKISIILPAKNEAHGLRRLLPELKQHYPNAEVLVVDDGSTDDTAEVSKSHGVRVISHPYSKGNGAAVKSGARAASGDVLVFMDSDGQHSPAEIEKLLARIDSGYDMAVGARSKHDQASIGRQVANNFYNCFASLITGHRVEDLTSGFRAVKADYFRRFLYMLPNGFSYPSSITMAFFRAGYSVTYVPVNVAQRIGKSHLRPIRDGLRFLLIIFRVGTLYSPLKIFVPASALLFLLGLGYYGYTYFMLSRFTNMSALLFICSILIFLIGLLSEQVTTLMYSTNTTNESRTNNDS